ncbi:MAG: DUF262 domain-containing protein [Brevinema sp.]
MPDNNNDLLKTVEDVFEHTYTIPEYQRGYKWTKDTVKKLLDDIDAFISPETPSESDFYCLQNITIIEKENNYEVIDGQQRLTTLAIILCYLGESKLVKGKIVYDIRDESKEFFEKYVIEKQEAHEYYDSEKGIFKKLPEDDYNRQDIFHFVQAAHTINEWIGKKNIGKENFAEKIREHVRLIVNNVEGDSKEKIFANLNANKVSLTAVDLIRAILITRITGSLNDKKDIVLINEKRVKLGWELDQAHQWWDGDPSTLFKGLIKQQDKDSIKQLSKDPQGIETLYLLYFNINEEKWLSIDEIKDILESKTEDIAKIYGDILDFHHTMQDWFNDPQIYHYLAFLAMQDNNTTIKDIYKLWGDKYTTRQSFINKLKERIVVAIDKDIPTEEKDSNDTKKLSLIKTALKEDNNLYHENQSFLRKTLILMDVITLLKNLKKSKGDREERRLPISYFKQHGEDIEHIFCQTPRKEDIEKVDITLLSRDLNSIEGFTLGEEDKKSLEKANKEEIFEIYTSILEKVPNRNSVGNLLLLNSGVNRSYGNDEYTRKRERIIKEYQEGKYIRPHTWTIFTKNFSTSKEDLNTWGLTDIDQNKEYISNTIGEFLGGVQ